MPLNVILIRYVIIGADASAGRSILVFQQDQDKVFLLSFF